MRGGYCTTSASRTSSVTPSPVDVLPPGIRELEKYRGTAKREGSATMYGSRSRRRRGKSDGSARASAADPCDLLAVCVGERVAVIHRSRPVPTAFDQLQRLLAFRFGIDHTDPQFGTLRCVYRQQPGTALHEPEHDERSLVVTL